jgi:hypothetical protein
MNIIWASEKITENAKRERERERLRVENILFLHLGDKI